MCPQHEISRPDKYVYEKEIKDASTKETDQEKEFAEMARQMDHIMTRYFPEAFGYFLPPTIETLTDHFQIVTRIACGEGIDQKPKDNPTAFNFVAAVRYVDNFIDEALWPLLEEKKKKNAISDNLESIFSEFLKKLFDVVKKYDEYFPIEILELPKLEMHMFLHPDQQTFDDSVENYVDSKAYNLSYVEHLFTKKRPAEMSVWSKTEKDRFRLMALWDISRDMQHWEESTDFDILHHIDSYDLDPARLVAIILDTIQKNSPATYRLLEGNEYVPTSVHYTEVGQAMSNDGIGKEDTFLLRQCLDLLNFLQEKRQGLSQAQMVA